MVFNTEIEIANARLPQRPSDAPALVTELTRELAMGLKRWTANQDFRLHRIHVHEAWQHQGVTTVIAAHVPAALGEDAEAWLMESFLMRRFGGPMPSGAVSFRLRSADDAPARFSYHLDAMRLLCRSIDPALEVRAGGGSRRLIDVLGIPARWRKPLVPLDLSRRFEICHSLNARAQRDAAADGLAPLSAVADGAWEHLASGWELDEYRDRQREKAERAAALRQLDLDWPEPIGPDAQLRQQANDRLRRS